MVADIANNFVNNMDTTLQVSAFAVYLMGTVDSIQMILKTIGILSICLFIIPFMIGDFECSIYILKSIKVYICIGMLMFILSFFIPSSKTIAAMYVLPALSEGKINDKIMQSADMHTNIHTNQPINALVNLTQKWLRDFIDNSNNNGRIK